MFFTMLTMSSLSLFALCNKKNTIIKGNIVGFSDSSSIHSFLYFD